MKAVVLLLLCLSAFALPSLTSDFLTGVTEGSAGPRFCLENPLECGKTVGQLTKVFTSVYEKYQSNVCFQCAQDYIVGLTNGLRATNATTSTCVADFQSGNYDLASLYEILWDMVYDYYVPITLDGMVDLTCTISAVMAIDFIRDCNLKALFNNIINISGDILVQEYMDNMCEVNTAIYGVANCNLDYTYCGYSTGYLIKTLLNWAI